MLSLYDSCSSSRVKEFFTRKEYSSQFILSKKKQEPAPDTQAGSDNDQDQDRTQAKKKRKMNNSAPDANMNCLDMGKVFVSPEGYKQFLTNFALDVTDCMRLPKTMDCGHCAFPRFYLNEIANSLDTVVRVWFEMDFFIQSFESYEDINNKFDNPDGFIAKVSRVLIGVLRSCFSKGNQMHISVIAEQSQGADTGKSITSNDVVIYKFGIHLKAVEIFVMTKHLLLLRCKLIDALDAEINLTDYKIVSKDPPTGAKRGVLEPATWSKVIDDNPIGRGKGLRLTGSFKVDPCSGCKGTKGRATCTLCNQKRIVHVDRYYWPRVWFYERLSKSPAVNVTEFFELTKSANTQQNFVCHGIDTNVLSLSKLMPLLSIKTNGHKLQHEDTGFEKPVFPRSNETCGFAPPHIPDGIAKYSSTKHTSSSNTCEKKDSTLFLTSAIEFRGQDAYFANAAIRKAMQRPLLISSIVHNNRTPQIQTDVQKQTTPGSKSTSSLNQPLKPIQVINDDVNIPVTAWERKLASNKLLTRIVDTYNKKQQQQHQQVDRPLSNAPTCPDISWDNLAIRLINAGMVNNELQKQSFYKLFPETTQTLSFLSTIQQMPYLLHVFVDPEKNESSRMCPIKGSSHETNNIYFQMILPFVTDIKINETNVQKDAEQTLFFVNAMINTYKMIELTGMFGWPLTVRCWCKACGNKNAHYIMPWENVLQLVEPILTRLLTALNVKKVKNSNAYIKEL